MSIPLFVVLFPSRVVLLISISLFLSRSESSSREEVTASLKFSRLLLRLLARATSPRSYLIFYNLYIAVLSRCLQIFVSTIWISNSQNFVWHDVDMRCTLKFFRSDVDLIWNRFCLDYIWFLWNQSILSWKFYFVGKSFNVVSFSSFSF